MMLFIDTWGWLTLRDRREARHKEVKTFYQEVQKQKGRIYTTDYVLDETYTLLFKRLPYSVARESVERLNEAVLNGYLLIEWITPERFEEAKKLRMKYQDKPRISFTDLTSIVVMNKLKIVNILTEDSHFIQVDMGFKVVP